MVRRDNLIILCFCILFVIACLPGINAKLVVQKNKYVSNELKIDGYYYSKSKSKLSEDSHYNVFFFYKNGIIRDQSVRANSLFEVDIEIKKGGTRGLAPKAIHTWGIFKIERDNITYEKWGSSSGGPKKTILRVGRILNDTTYVIDRLKNNYRKKWYTVNDTFHFKQFSPKPDSTNSFIP